LADYFFASWARPCPLPEERSDRGTLAHLFRQHRDGALAADDCTRHANAELSDTTIPCAETTFSKAGDPRYFWTEHIKSHGEDISLIWFDIGEPLLIHSQPNQIPNRRYGVCTVLIPALGTRLVRNGIEAKGQSWPREREGRPFSTSALAFSESWTDAV
jgi:hypothetical protein